MRKPPHAAPQRGRAHPQPLRAQPQSPTAQRGRRAPHANADTKPHQGHARSHGHGGEVWLYGLHPVMAALRNPSRKILRVVGTAESLARLKDDSEIPASVLAHAHATGRAELDTLVGARADK
ncbi:MAG: hypothetical protein EPO08_01015, partial [Rhodospirillaceae bacterium]